MSINTSNNKYLFFLPGLLLIFSNLISQPLSVSIGPDEYIARTSQLLNDSSSTSWKNISFMVKPVYASNIESFSKKIHFTLLPFQHLQQINDRVPFRYSDGALLPTRGWQGYYSGGFRLMYKNVDLMFKPEYIWAFNSDFPTFPPDHYNIIWNYYYLWLNKIDSPEKFDGAPSKKGYLGQSHFEYSFRNLAFGISTENIWWGPGRFNSLTMSNNAPGFFHYQVHSKKPISTKIGSFEWQYIFGGRLKNSNTLPEERNRSFNGIFLYNPKDSIHHRILSGGVISWEPKWIPGLFIGSDAVSMIYKGAKGKPAKMGSVFARYAMPKDNAEIYFQYGRSDKFATIPNLLGDTIPRGYLGGIRKLFPLSKRLKGNTSYIQLGIEITQLAVPNVSLIKQAKSWYTHDIIRQGFTNDGQVLGAYIGPGSNAQLFEISWIKGKSKLGLEFQRWLHNADFYYNYNINSGSFDFNRQWVDLSSSLVWHFPIRKCMFFGQFSLVRSINYNWKSYIPQRVTPENYFSDGWDFINTHGRMGVQVDMDSFIKKRIFKK